MIDWKLNKMNLVVRLFAQLPLTSLLSQNQCWGRSGISLNSGIIVNDACFCIDLYDNNIICITAEDKVEVDEGAKSPDSFIKTLTFCELFGETFPTL